MNTEKQREYWRNFKKQWYLKHPNHIKDYYKNNRERIRNNYKRYYNLNKENLCNSKNISNRKLKIDTFSYYSNGTPKCACCGEDIIEFLTIDHINGFRESLDYKEYNKHKHGTSLYSWLKRNKYPEGYQVLCFNCNSAKGHHGICPHTKIFIDK
jgi:hypothetical protein